MSYLSPQAGEIVASNDHQPTDITHDSWSSMSNTYGSQHHPVSETPWAFRQPPRLRHGAKS